MKAVTGLLPWAVALVLIGAAIWFLYDRQMAAGRWLFAGLLVAHGAVHVLYLVPQPAAAPGGLEWPFDIARAWPVSAAGLDPGVVRMVAVGLVGVVVVGFVLAGLATVGVVVPTTWWPALVGLSAALSLVVLVLLFDPQLLAGVVLDLVLIWLAILTDWRPTTA
jgi:hypothetical protein